MSLLGVIIISVVWVAGVFIFYLYRDQILGYSQSKKEKRDEEKKVRVEIVYGNSGGLKEIYEMVDEGELIWSLQEIMRKNQADNMKLRNEGKGEEKGESRMEKNGEGENLKNDREAEGVEAGPDADSKKQESGNESERNGKDKDEKSGGEDIWGTMIDISNWK